MSQTDRIRKNPKSDKAKEVTRQKKGNISADKSSSDTTYWSDYWSDQSYTSSYNSSDFGGGSSDGGGDGGSW